MERDVRDEPGSSRPTTSRAASARRRRPSTSPTSPPRDGARDAAVGSRPAGREHLPVPGQAEGQGRRAQARARQSDVDALIKGTDHERPRPAARRTSPTATWTSRSTPTKRPTRRLARVLAPLPASTTTSFLDCPPSISLVSESVFEAADALLVPIIPATLSARTFEQLRAGSPPPSGARARRCWRSSRWSTAASACTARSWSSLAAEHAAVLRTVDPGGGRRRAHGPAAHGDRAVRAPQPRRPRLRRALARGARTLRARGRGDRAGLSGGPRSGRGELGPQEAPRASRTPDRSAAIGCTVRNATIAAARPIAALIAVIPACMPTENERTTAAPAAWPSA